MSAGPTAVVLSLEDPWASQTGGTLRTRAILRSLRDLGLRPVCVFSGSSEPAPQPEPGIESLPIGSTPVGSRSWPLWVKQLKRRFLPLPTRRGAANTEMARTLAEFGEVEVLVVAALSQVQYVSALPARTVWVDFMDVWSDMAERELVDRGLLARTTVRIQQRSMRRAEHAVAVQATIVTAAGWHDARVLEQRTGREVVWLPNTAERKRHNRVRGGGGLTAGFLGNFEFWPNIDALRTLGDVWAPRLRQMGWHVVVAGRKSETVTMPDGVERIPELRNVEDFYQAVDVTLAPIRLGGGIKAKVIESLMFGVPVVATDAALEGFAPHLRSTAWPVDLNDPDFSFLAGLPSSFLDENQRLDVFTYQAFAETVCSILVKELQCGD